MGRREDIIKEFEQTHQPDNSIIQDVDRLDVFQLFTTRMHQYTEKQRKVREKMCMELDGYPYTPAKFLKEKYHEIAVFCAGSEEEAEVLYRFFDKMNQFSYSKGWERRTVRTEVYMDSQDEMIATLFAAYYLQMYECTLSQYLLNQLSEEMADCKNHFGLRGGLENIIAAHLDAKDLAVKEALTEIITGENNLAFVNTDMIRGIFKSDDKDMHKLLGQLLVAARLQEGIRQAVCENMDCGTIGAFRVMFDVIEENDLLRYSAVRRSVATWIGILDPDHLIRSSNKTFYLMKQVVNDKSRAYSLIESQDAVSILVGLWGLGFYEVNDAAKAIKEMISRGTIQQKRVAAFYSKSLNNKKIQYKIANQFVEMPEFDMEFAAELFDIYMMDCQREAAWVSSINQRSENKVHWVNLNLWFEDEETARRHMYILLNLFDSMKQKKYQFNPYLFPWYFTSVTRSDVLVRVCVIANGLQDQQMMDYLAERLSDLDASDNSRVSGVRLLFTGELNEKRRGMLIEALGDKESDTRREVFEIASELEFTSQELDKMCRLLRLKASDLRLNLISLIQKQKPELVKQALNTLLKDKNEDMHLAGIDIVRKLISDREESGETQYEDVIETGKILVQKMENPTEREQILIKELFSCQGASEETEETLYTEEDKIEPPVVFCDESKYPLFKVSTERFHEIYRKLDQLVDQYKDYEVMTAYGQTILLGNQESLPRMKYTGTIEECYPLISVWKNFYENEINNQNELMAMWIALMSQKITVGYGIQAICDENYNIYISKLAEKIFGSAVVTFDPSSYKYGKKNERTFSRAVKGGGLIYDIIEGLVGYYCKTDYLCDIGKKVAAYLCKNVCKDKRRKSMSVRDAYTIVITPLSSPIFNQPVRFFAETWNTKEQFKERFQILRRVWELFVRLPEGLVAENNISINKKCTLRAVDYVLAAYYHIITEKQMYYSIFEEGSLRSQLQDLFMIYRTEKYPAFKHELMKYGIFEDEKLEAYLRKVANTAAECIVRVECKRGDSLTSYSGAVTAIEFFYGIDHLVKLLMALGKDKFVRNDHLGYYGKGTRKENLCHLISVCHPLPEDTVETFKNALKGTSVDEKRLIELAMYAPQWVDLIEEYLNFTGLKSGAYYFMAHMNDQYNKDQRKFAAIARFTPLEKEELFNGAFDIAWFEEAYRVLGEKRFQMLYDAAKYSSDGSRHTRARKYADAALGNVKTEELEREIIEKRNKDLLMSYPLVPLNDEADMLHRYQFIQKFRKESTQFGSQRRASEGLACDMAMRNLATRAGFKDVTRLTLVMEMALVDSLRYYFEWTALESEKTAIEVRIHVSDAGKLDIAVRKGEKNISSVPAALKKHTYILELKEAVKKFREQYSRTVKMFELSMEERELYTIEEICKLRSNPVIAPIAENLVYISEKSGICGTVRLDQGIGLIDENGEIRQMEAAESIRVAHPYDLYKSGTWSAWQKMFHVKHFKNGSKQPFRQVFRELYLKLDEELKQNSSRMFAGYQIQPTKTVAALKTRRWIADHESGLEKIFYKDNIVVTMYALADWFSPSDIEPPILEYVAFSDRKTFKWIPIEEVPDIVYSEAMRDVDLAVSVAHAGGVDPVASHSTIEMRRVIAQCNMELFGLKNVRLEGSHAFIKGSFGEYTVHLGSGVVHMQGVHQLNVLPVQSQHRGKIFLPFLDEDPKTAEIISKILLFAEDKKIKDPYILNQMK